MGVMKNFKSLLGCTYFVFMCVKTQMDIGTGNVGRYSCVIIDKGRCSIVLEFGVLSNKTCHNNMYINQ